MMDMCRTQLMTDIIHKSIAYSGIEREVIGTPIYNRLHRVLQSSLVYLTFSSNKVKRFEHSIGTMFLAGEVFFNSICNAGDDDLIQFFQCVDQEITKWQDEIDTPPYILPETIKKYKTNKLNAEQLVPKCNLYNTYFPGNLCSKKLAGTSSEFRDRLIFGYFVIFQSIRLVGAIHDIGHLPYSHVIERALNNLYDKINNLKIKNPHQNFFVSIMDRYLGESKGKYDLPLHEAIGEKLVARVFSYITDDLQRSDNPNNIFLACVIDFTKKIIRARPSDRNIFSELHLIVDGVLDADRLDYVSRDAFCAGMRKDIFPYERFIPTYRLAKALYEEHEAPLIETCAKSVSQTRKEGFFFCPATKSTREITDLLERRWRIFMDINYHHRVHKHETLMEEIFVELGERELRDNPNVPEQLPDILPLKVSSIWQLVSLINSNEQMLEYQIIQMDDSWLDTLLKSEFFSLYKEDYFSTTKYANDPLWNGFNELISAKKHYSSLIKRSIDFMSLDQALFTKYVQKYKKRGQSSAVSRMLRLEDLSNVQYTDYYTKNSAFFVDRVFSEITPSVVEHILTNIRDDLKKKKGKTSLKEYHVQDCIIRVCDIGMGCNVSRHPVYVCNEKGDPIRLSQHIPKLDEAFRRERALSPQFHVYYLPEYDIQSNRPYKVDQNALIKLVASAIFEATSKVLEELAANK